MKKIFILGYTVLAALFVLAYMEISSCYQVATIDDSPGLTYRTCSSLSVFPPIKWLFWLYMPLGIGICAVSIVNLKKQERGRPKWQHIKNILLAMTLFGIILLLYTITNEVSSI